MIEVGRRRRALPAPPHIVAGSLRDPDQDPPGRPWLHLLPDEQRPRVVESGPELLVWSSLWPRQPEALVRFDLVSDGAGTDLTWTLLVADLPDASRLGHYRKRINELIHRDLRSSYGQ